MTPRENMIRTILFDYPDYIPMVFAINPACWNHYEHEQLWELMETHPLLFPDWERPAPDWKPDYGNNAQKDHPYKDNFGCVWHTTEDGITGTVTEHPLTDWDQFEEYKKHAPDPEHCMGIGEINWEETEKAYKKAKEAGAFLSGGLRHGHTFLQLCDIRGYEDFLFDMEDEEPKLWELIELVENFNARIVDHYLKMDVDQMGYAEDLGMQVGPMLSVQNFRTYIKPSYQRLMKPARDKDVLIHMHSDGDIRLLVDDIVDSGVQSINLQDLVNGIDWIADRFRGKTCVDLDIDRQKITRFGTPAEIDALIREEVEKIADPAGGLSMIYGLYPGVPIENVKALMDAMERYMPRT